MVDNPTAGLGDPFWYEWSVGLEYVIEMLNPDSNIASVTFQASGVKGLDDVVIRFHDGTARSIQVKHTRANDTLTFGDLVERDEKGVSLLSHLAVAWLSAKCTGFPCDAYLLTNRPLGKKSSTAALSSGGTYVRPSLAKFWPHLMKEVGEAKRIDDINMPVEWSDAWQVWRGELEKLPSDDQRLAFLMEFVINADQPGLQELEQRLHKQIGDVFGVDSQQARTIFRSLNEALRCWTTSRRVREEVTLEMAYQAISSIDEPPIGDHELAPPEPFFPSRRKFVDELGAALVSRVRPVVFFTGPPGSGKTSVINELANRREPIIDLRFHAFRPVTPDMPTLPTDAGRTATSEALWGDLLVQLRRIFRGRLAYHRVPVRNDFLDADSMRMHVLRLAQVLAKEQGRPTVIAIDGVDHAARAGYHHLTLLQSLVPPDKVPQEVCFLVAGQPGEAYEKYPFWLRSSHDLVAVWHVPEIQLEDVMRMLQSAGTPLSVDSLEPASRLILAFASGNTLPAVFAIHEAGSCSDLLELQERLTHRRLGDGLSAYYESIWEAALRPLQTQLPFSGYRLAGCISLTPERLTGKTLAGIFSDLSISAADWTEAMRMLRPLVTEDLEGFRVTHNDVRVYLTRQMESQPQRMTDVASRMADFYLTEADAVLPRHVGVFNLLRLAGRESDQARVFTSNFVMEAWSIDRPMTEIVEQARSALRSAVISRDWNYLHGVACAISTVKQLRSSLVWTDRTDRGKENLIPPVLSSEGRVPNLNLWTTDLINATLSDAMRLIRANQVDRASGLMRRWFSGLLPTEVITMLFDKGRHCRGGSDEPILDESAKRMLRLWGRVSRHTGSPFNCSEPTKDRGTTDEQFDLHVAATFHGGWLEEACESKGKLDWAHALLHARPYYLADMEACLSKLARDGRWCEAGFTLTRLGKSREMFSTAFKAQAAVWSLIIGRSTLIEAWANPLSSDPFKDLNHTSSADGESVEATLAASCFVLGWLKPTRPIGGISEDGLQAYSEVYPHSERLGHLSRLLFAAAWAGRTLGWTGGIDTLRGLTSPNEFRHILRALLFPDMLRLNQLPFNFNSVAAELLSVLVPAGERMGVDYSRELTTVFREYAQTRKMWPAAETVWNTLRDRGDYGILQEWLDHWLSSNGAAWQEEVATRIEVVERLAALAVESGMEHLVLPAERRLKWGWIGYAGHKEYALGRPLAWFTDLSGNDLRCWRNEGLRLLALSNEASRVGDNRLSTSVEAAVATAIAASGPEHLWCLMKAGSTAAKHQWMPGNSKMLFDGVIGMLESATLTESDLLALWCLGIGALIWQDGYDRGYLADLRRAICEAAGRMNYRVESQLREIGPTESLAESNRDLYRSPERWFSEAESTKVTDGDDEWTRELLSMAPENALSSLQRQITGKEAYGTSRQWRTLAKLVRRFKAEHPVHFPTLAQRSLSLLKQREYPYRWSYDGAHRVYEELVPVLSQDQCWEIASDIARSLVGETTDIFLESAEENVDFLCRLRARSAGIAETKMGLERLLATHELWVEAHGKLPAINRPMLPGLGDKELRWSGLVAEALLDLVQSESSHGAEAALRGLWALMKLDVDSITRLKERWGALDPHVRSRVLLMAERAARESPDLFVELEPMVSTEYSSGGLTSRIQAWVALQAFQSRMGQLPYPLQVAGFQLPESVTTPSNAGLLEVDGEAHGHIVSSTGVVAVHSFLRQLRAAVREDLLDVEATVADSLVVNPVSSVPRNNSETRPGDIRLHPAPQVDRLMEIVAGEMASGRWDAVPSVCLAQALTYGDDPFILLRSPLPAPGRESWPVDRQLDDLIEQRGVGPALQAAVTAGLTDDNMVLSAGLYTYTRGLDLEYRVDPIWKRDPADLTAVETRSTFNGRTFPLYSVERFEPPHRKQGTTLTLWAGGMAIFPHQRMYVVPSVLWQEQFGWRPSPENPLVWLENDRPVVWFENLVGPFRNENWDPWFRQPILQRWICSRTTFDTLKKRVSGHLTIHSDWKTFKRSEY